MVRVTAASAGLALYEASTLAYAQEVTQTVSAMHTGRGSRWMARGLVALLALLLAGLIALFTYASLVRALNFDESLALKAGWILLSPYEGKPTFLMPVTVLLGGIAHAFEDPGVVLGAARVAVLATVLPSLAWALWQLPSRAHALMAACALLLQSTFIAHGLEFRYDWALLLGWLWSYALLAGKGEPRYAAVGACAAWIGAHHAKGLFFGSALLCIAAALTLARSRRIDGKALGRLGAGAAAAGAGWLLLCALLGRHAELVQSYADFFRLGRDLDLKVWPWEALEKPFSADAPWWGAALASTALVALRSIARRPAVWMGRGTLLALPFGLIPMAFTLVHPHPWSYMLALPAPFFAIVLTAPVAAALDRQSWGWLTAQLAAIVVLFVLLSAGLPWRKYAHSISHDRESTVATLRRLRGLAEPGERVVDPTGLAYFLPPCTEEWYIDTLFRRRLRQGAWMQELRRLDLSRCRWLVVTYRARWLPSRTVRRLARDYRRCSGGPRVHVSVAHRYGCRKPASLRSHSLPSYW